MLKLLCLYFSAFLLFSASLSAQSPFDVYFVIDKAAVQLDERASYTNLLTTLETRLAKSWNANAPLVKQVFTNPNAVGLENRAHILGFLTLDGEVTHSGLQFAVADVTKLEAAIALFAQNNLDNLPEVDATITDEKIRIALEAQYQNMFQKRQQMFTIRTLDNSDFRYVALSTRLLAWNAQHFYVLQSKIDGGVINTDTYFDQITIEQLNFLKTLSPLEANSFDAPVQINLTAATAQALNSNAPTILHRFLDDNTVVFPTENQYLTVDFTAVAVEVKLWQQDEVIQSKSWTLEELLPAALQSTIETNDDGLDVFLKRLQFVFDR